MDKGRLYRIDMEERRRLAELPKDVQESELAKRLERQKLREIMSQPPKRPKEASIKGMLLIWAAFFVVAWLIFNFGTIMEFVEDLFK